MLIEIFATILLQLSYVTLQTIVVTTTATTTTTATKSVDSILAITDTEDDVSSAPVVVTAADGADESIYDSVIGGHDSESSFFESIVISPTKTSEAIMQQTIGPSPPNVMSVLPVDADIAAPSVPLTSETVVPNDLDGGLSAIWSTLDPLNYYANVCSLYDTWPYLNSARDNVKLALDHVLTQFVALNSLWSSSTADNDGTDDTANHRITSSYLSKPSYWPAISYHLYNVQTILFRVETIAFICVLFIFALFLYSFVYCSYRRRSGNDEPNVGVDLPTATSSLCSALAPPKSHLLGRIFAFFNFTILVSNVFAMFEVAFRGLRAAESITIQESDDHVAVFSMQGRRPNMEDTFTLKNSIAKELGIEYYAVYDGHGGQNAAIYSEKEIYDSVIKRIRDILFESNKENCEESEAIPKLPIDVCKSPELPSSTCVAASTRSKVRISSSLARSNKSFPANRADQSPNRFDVLTVNTLKSILHEEIIKVDKRLVEQFRKRNDISGSTALIAIRLVHTNTLLVANVGDSRAILCDWKGATIPLSFDHKPYQLKEYRRIVEAGGYIMLKGVYRVNGILAVSRALGDYPLKEDRLVIADPDILSFDLNELKPRFMIVASDGFWDTFSNENAVRFVQNELSRHAPNYTDAANYANLPLYIARKLANESYARESYDNITVIVLMFDGTANAGGGVKIGHASCSSPAKANRYVVSGTTATACT